jgi:hypothetical protein
MIVYVTRLSKLNGIKITAICAPLTKLHWVLFMLCFCSKSGQPDTHGIFEVAWFVLCPTSFFSSISMSRGTPQAGQADCCSMPLPIIVSPSRTHSGLFVSESRCSHNISALFLLRNRKHKWGTSRWRRSKDIYVLRLLPLGKWRH